MSDTNYLGMSDEEWLKQPMPTSSVDDELEAPAEDAAEAKETEEVPATADEATPEDEPTGEDEGAGAEAAGAEDKEDATPETKEVAESSSTGIDYKAAYEQLTKPFKANGRDIQVTSVDDAVALMQMGANYNKKMAALKPNLKLMKLLESNGLMSEEKIGFLIDLQNKNPAAINRLIQDSGIDPMELDASKAEGYTPTVKTVDDRELELDQVLDDLKSSDTYTRTLQVVSKEWDGASKQVIADSPQLLKVINSHMESGIYDLISNQVENERMFGRLSGLSAIEAYRQIGDAIQARGGFNHIRPDVNTAPVQKPVVVEKARPSEEQVQKVKDRKRAASASTAAAPTAQTKEFNPLALSDEDFGKLVQSKYL